MTINLDYCEHCGSLIKQGQPICEICGRATGSDANLEQPEDRQGFYAAERYPAQTEPDVTPPPAPSRPWQRNRVWWTAGIILVLAACCLVILLAAGFIALRTNPSTLDTLSISMIFDVHPPVIPRHPPSSPVTPPQCPVIPRHPPSSPVTPPQCPVIPRHAPVTPPQCLVA